MHACSCERGIFQAGHSWCNDANLVMQARELFPWLVWRSLRSLILVPHLMSRSGWWLPEGDWWLFTKQEKTPNTKPRLVPRLPWITPMDEIACCYPFSARCRTRNYDGWLGMKGTSMNRSKAKTLTRTGEKGKARSGPKELWTLKTARLGKPDSRPPYPCSYL